MASKKVNNVEIVARGKVVNGKTWRMLEFFNKEGIGKTGAILVKCYTQKSDFS